MDLIRTIAELRGEKAKLDRVIAALEELQAATAVRALLRSRRGRKSMSAEERQEVSARMKKYWARERKQEQAGP